jgi:hypothetical protein
VRAEDIRRRTSMYDGKDLDVLAAFAQSWEGGSRPFRVPWLHNVEGRKPPSGADHDGNRMIVHRDGPRLYSRNAYDWTARLAAIAAAAELIKAKSFTIDGEATCTARRGALRCM